MEAGLSWEGAERTAHTDPLEGVWWLLPLSLGPLGLLYSPPGIAELLTQGALCQPLLSKSPWSLPRHAPTFAGRRCSRNLLGLASGWSGRRSM